MIKDLDEKKIVHIYNNVFSYKKGENTYVLKANPHIQEIDNMIRTRNSDRIVYSVDPDEEHLNLIRTLQSASTFIVMPYFGECLIDVINYSNMMNYTQQMLLSIFELHDLKIAHKDIKIDNFVIDSNNMVRICDLECIKHTAVTSPLSTYRDQKYSFQDDIESFGYVLLQLVNGGQLPWEDCSEHKQYFLKKQFSQKHHTLNYMTSVQNFIQLSTQYDQMIKDQMQIHTFRDNLIQLVSQVFEQFFEHYQNLKKM